tara:strand:+ start:1395 stop:2006 length:612 start_codon:yes stop_codon:yes gene_type:complete
MKATDMLNQIKEVLGIELSEEKVVLAEMTLENGTKIQAESFEVGQQVFIVSDSEDSIPLPIGKYTLDTGEILSVTSEGIIGSIGEANNDEPAEEEAPEVEASDETTDTSVKSEETTHKVVYATKEEVENLTSMIAELKTMIEAKEAPETLVEEKTEDIELAAEVVEPIAHNPEAVDTQTETSFTNVTVQKAKYLNNLVNQFNS